MRRAAERRAAEARLPEGAHNLRVEEPNRYVPYRTT